jgi:hypothetical protein
MKTINKNLKSKAAIEFITKWIDYDLQSELGANPPTFTHLVNNYFQHITILLLREELNEKRAQG